MSEIDIYFSYVSLYSDNNKYLIRCDKDRYYCLELIDTDRR